MKNYLLFILIFIFCCKLRAQDPSFSQFYFNQLYYNPAFCGFTGGTYVSASVRSLWPKIPGHYNTQKFSVDFDISQVIGLGGLGFIITNDDEGPSKVSSGNLRTISIGIPFSMRPINFFEDHNSKSKINLQFGVLPSIIKKNINWDKLIFSDQYSAIDGDFISSSSFYNSDNNTGRMLFDLSAGGVIDYKGKLNRRYYHITLGGACYHILEHSQFFYNFESKLPMKLVGHLSIQRNIKSDNSISFSVISECQKKMRSILIGTNFLFNHAVFCGTWFRGYPNSNADAIIFLFGAGVPAFSKKYHPFISYSYDFTISKLAPSARGSHEINVTVLIDQSKIKCKLKRYVDPFIVIEHHVKKQN